MPYQTGSIKIFISYRRDDSLPNADRLSEHLGAYFGSQVVFIDTESIQLGRDYVEVIEEEVRSCGILLAVIGRQWLTCSNEGGRRLDDPRDFVRREIALALRQGVRVIPILVQGASMPRVSDLPEELAPLARRQAGRLDDKYWRQNVRDLIEKIEVIMQSRAVEPLQEVTSGPHSVTRPGQIIAAVTTLVLLTLILSAYYYFYGDEVIEVPQEIQVLDSDCKYMDNRFTCSVMNNIPNRTIIGIEVELVVEVPNASPNLMPTPVPNPLVNPTPSPAPAPTPVLERKRLLLDPEDSGKPFKTSWYRVTMSYDRRARVHLNRPINLVVAK